MKLRTHYVLEYVIEVTGTVALRGEGLANPNLKTGTMELEVHHVELLAKAKTPPIYIEDDKSSFRRITYEISLFRYAS